jgi:hypothetical protein
MLKVRGRTNFLSDSNSKEKIVTMKDKDKQSTVSKKEKLLSLKEKAGSS